MTETVAARHKRSLDTRNTEALERIAQTIEEFPGTPLKSLLRILQHQGIQATKAATAEREGETDSAMTGFPPVPFEVKYTADQDDPDRHITVQINDDSGVYFLFSEAGNLIMIGSTKG